ncbi:T9SS type A sorting domain-containing protein [Spirosoma luteum]|uniref:T9SS type A sorting domain-containing protein n=1 Tax=Spirosoma luteum TaxID=431553 RepID=UPI000476022C|nr:T9SS type A sorting domain-containing protein [Spirosoma luteum]
MNPFLLTRPLGRRNHCLLRKPVRIGVVPCWWLMCLLFTGFNNIGWGQCFNTTTLPAGRGLPYSVAGGDFNGDGRADLVAANLNTDRVSVLLGNGGGGFGAPTDFAVGSSPHRIAVADFNADGRADLAVANLASNYISVLLGTGSGGFEPAVSYTVGTSPSEVAVGDFNADGKADLAVANYNSSNVSVLLGNGSGGFGTATNFPVGKDPITIALGDFNSDGKVDLVVANQSSNTVSVLLGNGSGGFGAAAIFAVGLQPGGIVVSDFNADGKADLAVANYISNNVSVLLGTGGGGFGVPTNYPVGNNPISVALGDVNGDGKADMAVSNYASNNISVLLANGSGGFGVAVNFPVGTGPNVVVVGEFNGDGRPDLAVSNFNSNNVSVLINCSFTITGVTPVSCATVTATERQLTFSPQYAGTTGQPISFSVVNEMLPTTSPGPHTLRLYTDNPTITLKATQSGTPGEAGFNYNWLAACGASPPPADFAITGATVNCQTVSATERRVMLSPQYTGVSGQPISFSVVNEMLPTTSPGPYTLRLYTDNPIIRLRATQFGTAGEASFNYNWLANCMGLGVARLGTGLEPTAGLRVRLLGNPVHTMVEVEVTGREDKPLNLSLTDVKGHLVDQRRTERAGAGEYYRFDVSNQPAGILLLRTSSQGQSETVRILKVN